MTGRAGLGQNEAHFTGGAVRAGPSHQTTVSGVQTDLSSVTQCRWVVSDDAR